MSIFRKKEDELVPQVEIRGEDIIIQNPADEEPGQPTTKGSKPKRVKSPPSTWA